MGKRKGTKKELKYNQAQLEKTNEEFISLLKEIINLNEGSNIKYKENKFKNW